MNNRNTNTPQFDKKLGEYFSNISIAAMEAGIVSIAIVFLIAIPVIVVVIYTILTGASF